MLSAHEHIIDQHNKDLYNLSYMTSYFVALLLNGKSIPKFDEVFKSKETVETTNNDYVRELFLDYAEA